MLGTLRLYYLAWCSNPAGDRRIYQLIRKHQLSKILELGVGNLERAQRMIEMARLSGCTDVRYCGIDLFEMRRDGQAPGTSLKEAHRTLTALGVKPRLVPGDPFSALSRSANTLTGQDLIIISLDQQGASLEQAWFYVPRLLHADSIVLLEEASGTSRQFRQLERAEVEQRASTTHRLAA